MNKFLLNFGITILSITLLLLSVLLDRSSVRAAQVKWEKTLQAAKEEGQVVIYSSRRFDRIFAVFQKKYPEIKVVHVTGRTSGVIQRIMSERRAGKHLVDFVAGGGSTMYFVLYKGKHLAPLKPALILPEVVDESKWWRGKHWLWDDEGKYILAFNMQLEPYFAYNTKLVNLKEIKSYWDFLNPKWKGKIIALDPTSGGGVSVCLRFMYYNPELGPDFLRRIFSETGLTAGRDPVRILDRLATGRFAISLCNTAARAGIYKAKEQGLPVNVFGPKDLKEGTILSAAAGNLVLLNRAPHPNAARIAINWLLSREGQITYQRISPGTDSARIDIPKEMVNPYARRVKGAKYFITERPDLMDRKPIMKIINEAWKKRRK